MLLNIKKVKSRKLTGQKRKYYYLCRCNIACMQYWIIVYGAVFLNYLLWQLRFLYLHSYNLKACDCRMWVTGHDVELPILYAFQLPQKAQEPLAPYRLDD